MADLEGFGLRKITWDQCDRAFLEELPASGCDSGGRGIALAILRDGETVDLGSSTVYLVWKHRLTGCRGCEPFESVTGKDWQWEVRYPRAMLRAHGLVDANILVRDEDGSCLSTLTLRIRVGRNLVDGCECQEDGFSLFLDAIAKYEEGIELETAATEAANAAAAAANLAAANADAMADSIAEAAARGDYNGAQGVAGVPGAPGKDGVSPVATVTEIEGGVLVSIQDATQSTSAVVRDGAKGDKGDQGVRGPKGAKGDPGDPARLEVCAPLVFEDGTLSVDTSGLGGSLGASDVAAPLTVDEDGVLSIDLTDDSVSTAFSAQAAAAAAAAVAAHNGSAGHLSESEANALIGSALSAYATKAYVDGLPHLTQEQVDARALAVLQQYADFTDTYF